jgi:hypothetical protein
LPSLTEQVEDRVVDEIDEGVFAGGPGRDQGVGLSHGPDDVINSDAPSPGFLRRLWLSRRGRSSRSFDPSVLRFGPGRRGCNSPEGCLFRAIEVG